MTRGQKWGTMGGGTTSELSLVRVFCASHLSELKPGIKRTDLSVKKCSTPYILPPADNTCTHFTLFPPPSNAYPPPPTHTPTHKHTPAAVLLLCHSVSQTHHRCPGGPGQQQQQHLHSSCRFRGHTAPPPPHTHTHKHPCARRHADHTQPPPTLLIPPPPFG